MDTMDYFMQIYGTLPRAGPGDNASTARAFGMCEGLPPEPKILDIGCGPGMQTLELARLSKGFVLALDKMPQMIERVRSAVEEEGLSDRINPMQMDMHDMNFEADCFDLIWSEGAIYFLGFRAGLEKIKPFVKPGGYVVVSEAVWLKEEPSQEALDFWGNYPAIDTVEAKLGVIDELGYERIGHFVLPRSSWEEHYYKPMKVRLEEVEPKWKDIPEGMNVIKAAHTEIDLFQRSSDYFSYGFFVMRK